MLAALMLMAAPQPAGAADVGARDAALMCASVAASGATSDTRLIGAAHVTYYLTQAAHLDTGATTLMAALGRVKSDFAARPPLSIDQGRRMVSVCDARFPVARRTGQVVLPTDGLRRNVMCVMELNFIGGSSEKAFEQTGDRTALDRYLKALKSYRPLSDAAISRAGYPNEAAAQAPIEQTIVAALDLGNAYAIADTCIAALPSS
ncbi:MAG: hypothetical protein ACTHJR_12990 [Sphingomonas sp.]|uniref:hypothetical protein n=1 Tax=Sphingomonas sp. TaxID=28214 RepID=UPI003F7EB2BA